MKIILPKEIKLPKEINIDIDLNTCNEKIEDSKKDREELSNVFSGEDFKL